MIRPQTLGRLSASAAVVGGRSDWCICTGWGRKVGEQLWLGPLATSLASEHLTSFHCIAFRLGLLVGGTGLFLIFLGYLEVCSLALGIFLSLSPFLLSLGRFFLGNSVLLDLFARLVRASLS